MTMEKSEDSEFIATGVGLIMAIREDEKRRGEKYNDGPATRKKWQSRRKIIVFAPFLSVLDVGRSWGRLKT